ncbi:MAG TPA: response regulator [Acidobacteriaceae bacterium]|jgi:CheY-like chemotaxis protein|nr:response regulator [Acidobacteriaceae bacterium]
MQPQILLVDDNPIQAVTRKAILERTGFSVKAFNSAREALRFLKEEEGKSIELVITDHIMPELAGPAFVRLLRDINPQIPVVVVSGLADAENEYQGYNVVFRTKPVAPDELQALAISLLDSPINEIVSKDFFPRQ